MINFVIVSSVGIERVDCIDLRSLTSCFICHLAGFAVCWFPEAFLKIGCKWDWINLYSQPSFY